MAMKHKTLALVCGAAVICSAGAAAGQEIVPPTIYSMSPTGVNISDGSYAFTDVDLTIGGLKLERFHLGGLRDPNVPAFAFRMSHNFDIYVAANSRTECPSAGPGCHTYKRPVIHMGLSSANFYQEGSPPHIFPSNDDSYQGDLTYSGSAYVYTNSNGDVYNFSATVTANGVGTSQRVANIVFANGNRQDFLYSGNLLKAVIDSSGYAIVFDYNGSGFVSKACGYNTSNTFISASSTCTGAALSVSYGYAGSPVKLSSVTDVTGNITTYDYTGDISCVKPPGYSTCKVANTYNTGTPYPWQVTQQTLADGAVWNYSYSGDPSQARSPEQYAEVEPTYQATVTDPNGKASIYSFVVSSPYSAIDANGKVTEYRYSGGCNYQYFYSETAIDCSQLHYGSALVEATLPEGNKYLAEYSSPRRTITKQTMRAKPGSGLADRVTTFGYGADCTTPPNTPQNCAKPNWRKDAKGNQTDYTYASWGGTLSEMQPAPGAGAARPLKLYTYVQKYAYIKNSGGSLVPAASAIWLPSTETLCQTAAGSSTTTCDSGAPITVTTYEYGADGTADNLLVRGKVVSSGGVSLRTCYGYDWMGNKIWETSPRAGLAVCS